MGSRKKKRRSKKHKQEAGPRLFSDFGKIANGLLTKGYTQDQKLSISTRSSNGVILTSNATKHGKRSSAQIAASYTYGPAAIDVNIDTKSSFSTKVTLGGEFLPSTNIKASLRVPDYHSSKINLQFQHFLRNAALYMSVGLDKSPVVMLSAAIGTRRIAFGMEAKYKAASQSFSHCNAGISVTKRSYDASIILAERGDLLSLAYVHHFGRSRRISAVAEVTRRFSTNKNTLAIGGSCIMNHLTTVKAKLNYEGKLQALLRHKIYPKSRLTISGEFDTKALDKMPKIGLALSLML